MAVVITQKSWGYIATCTGGTAVAAVVIPKSTILHITGIACGGGATTDITTVQDGDNSEAGISALFKGAALVNTLNSIMFPDPITVQGLAVGFAGATTGYCNIYLT